MKKIIVAALVALPLILPAQAPPEALQPFPFGAIKPAGWLKTQLQQDLNGFVGNLDQIVPALIKDPIYGSGRLQKHSKAKDLGNLKAGDAEGDDQYKWWNSETQSNWWDGYTRNVLLLQNKPGMEKLRKYVESILATQDSDGYIGIYVRELRYRFSSENGELWSKATLYRGLLGYYEYTKDEKVFEAVKRAVENVMRNYPINASSPFYSGTGFNGGVSHGLTFTDVLERMYYHTGDQRYRDYALFLYRDFSNTWQSESDAQLSNILDPDYRFRSHGVHTYEHLRPLIVANAARKNDTLSRALSIYLQRIERSLTPSGGAIGDEWIGQRTADATTTGYEYCSLQELLDSYCLLLQKTGTAATGDAIENLFFNAAQGARNPKHSCIAYLKTDNSFEMEGTRNGEAEPDRKQTRYKYSPAHQEVAVCCNPNAGRISPYFLQNSWMRENETTLVAVLLAPNVLECRVGDQTLRIENATNYPYENRLHFRLRLERPAELTIRIRKPGWADGINTGESYTEANGFITVKRTFSRNDSLVLFFPTEVRLRKDLSGQHYFTYGPLLFARAIQSKEIKGKLYAGRFPDYTYRPLDTTRYAVTENANPAYQAGRIRAALWNKRTGRSETVELIPLGKTILRQAVFE